MKKISIALGVILCSTALSAADVLTIYNNNFALYKTKLNLNLKKGLQNYYWDNIPASIEAQSLIFTPVDKGLKLLSQNYEYDLANDDVMLNKYLGSTITVKTKRGTEITGKLIFFSGSLGIQTNKEMLLVNRYEAETIALEKLPSNFFIRPSLNLELWAAESGNYESQISYSFQNIDWSTTYNAVWNEENLQLSAWVTLNNNSGTKFEDVELKLMAGDVQKIMPKRYKANFLRNDVMSETAGADGSIERDFSEQGFADYHLYTLSDKLTINDKQTKQLKLFPDKIVKAEKKYYYYTNGTKTESRLVFKNDEKQGLGLPLPGGIIKLYQQDKKDKNLEFIGESKIENTAVNADVDVKIGDAFDLTGETTMLNQQTEKNGRKIYTDYKIDLKNGSQKDKTIVVCHQGVGNNASIYNSDVEFTKTSTNTFEAKVIVPAGKDFSFKFSQMSLY